MHELYELKEKLVAELKDYGNKELTAGSLATIDSLSHTIKNLCKIIEEYEDAEYSGNYPYMSYDGRSYRGSYRDGMSGARGRMNARRDSMGRYSGERGYSRTGLADELRGLMTDAPDERTRQEIQRLADKLESM